MKALANYFVSIQGKNLPVLSKLNVVIDIYSSNPNVSLWEKI